MPYRYYCSYIYKTTLTLLCCKMPRELALIVLGYWDLPRDCGLWYHTDDLNYFHCVRCGKNDLYTSEVAKTTTHA